jgi:hypothetical protein
LTEINFKIAFGVIDYKTFETKMDPNFVKWNVKIREGKNFVNNNNSKELKFHNCTDVDYDEFYESSPNHRQFYDLARRNKWLFCID